MKIKKEYVILCVVIVGLAVYLAKGPSDRTHYTLPVLQHVAQADINHILMEEADYKIDLVKQDNVWRIVPDNYLADSKKVSAMLNSLSSVTLTALVSEKGIYERYDLGADRKIAVTAFSGETVARKIDVGKAAETNQHTFVRLDGDDRVYHARGNLRSTFDMTAEQLRDKSVLTFDAKEITAMDIAGEGVALGLNQDMAAASPTSASKSENGDKDEEVASPNTVWKGTDGRTYDKGKVDSLVSTLSNLVCDGYIYNKTLADVSGSKALYVIKLTGTKPYTLTIYEKESDAMKTYPAVSSENTSPFNLPEWKISNIKTKLERLMETPSKTD